MLWRVWVLINTDMMVRLVSATAPLTNWLLTNAPGAYLQGALIELYGYLKDWEAKATELLASSPFGAGGKAWAGKDLWHMRSLLFTEPVDFLIGNTYGKYLERDCGTPLIRLVFPIFDRHHYHRFPTWGYNGALWLLTMLLESEARPAEVYTYVFLIPSLILALPAMAGMVDLERQAGCLDLALSAPSAEAYFVRRAAAVCLLAALQGGLIMLVCWLYFGFSFPILAALLERMAHALIAHGSNPLRHAIERWRDELMPVLSTAPTADAPRRWKGRDGNAMW